jgi:hypothetical protein
MRNSGGYLRRSGVRVPGLLIVRGIDASLGQIAARNRSFPESATRHEPLIRHSSAALLQCMSLLLAQSGHSESTRRCPLSGVKRTSDGHAPMSAFDPKRTFRLRVRFQPLWLPLQFHGFTEYVSATESIILLSIYPRKRVLVPPALRERNVGLGQLVSCRQDSMLHCGAILL